MVRIRASAWGTNELAALFLLVGGAILLPVIGPLVGLVAVARSHEWTRREKTLALSCVLGGLLLPLLVYLVGLAFGHTLNSAGAGDAAFVAAVLVTLSAFAVGAFLALALRARPVP